MAPKDKAPAGAPAVPEKDKKSSLTPETIWKILAISGGIAFLFMLAMIVMSLLVADGVKTLPEKLNEAQSRYKGQKEQYQKIFKTGSSAARGWKNFGRSQYYVSFGEKSWYDAENFCVSRNTHLASILTKEEQDYITSQFDEPAWIGLTDENEEGNWEWTDGSRLLAEYWFSGNPTYSKRAGGTKKDCTSIEPSSSGHNWNDANCHELKKWVCKESLDVKQQ